jgi:branched-chain amino acid transport system substrate-binding protein
VRIDRQSMGFLAALLLCIPACGGGTGPPLAGGKAVNAAAVGSSGSGDRNGVTPREILFGMHLPQSGPTGVLIGNAWKGTDAYFRAVNDAGGVHGRKLRLVVVDDKYSAQGAATAVRELIEGRKVFAVTCPAGIDQCSVTADYANSRGVPFLSGGFREQYLEDKPWAFPVTASNADGGARLLDYMFQQRGYTASKKIGFFYLHSENLDEMVSRADQEIARLGSRFTVKYPAEKDQSDFSAAVTKFQSAGVDTVWFHTAPDLISKFAAQAKILGFTPQWVFTLPVGGDIWAAAAGGNLEGAFGLAGFADPQWPGTAKFQADLHTYYPDDPTDEFNLLCYAIGAVFVEGVKRAGPDLGRDAFARALAGGEIDTGVSQPISYAGRGRVLGPNSKFAVWEIHGTRTEQVTGFDW